MQPALRKQVRFASPRRRMDCSLDCHEPRARGPGAAPARPPAASSAALDLSGLDSPALPTLDYFTKSVQNKSAREPGRVFPLSPPQRPRSPGLAEPLVFSEKETNNLNIVRGQISDDRGFFLRPDRPIGTFALSTRPPTVKLTNLDENSLKTKIELPIGYSRIAQSNLFHDLNNTQCTCYKCIFKYNKENCPKTATVYVKHPSVHSPYVPDKPNDALDLSFCSPCLQSTQTHYPYHQNFHHHCCSPSNGIVPKQNVCTKPCCAPRANNPHAAPISAELKSKAIENFEKRNKPFEICTEVETQKNIHKEKREPTVSDLFKIIKLQNEQLKLLQDRVDKLILNAHNITDTTSTPFRPVQNFVQERVAVETVDENHHKISIGVMTSFEMVRTSVIQKKEGAVKKNTQVQCNRSQVSVKEVISAEQCNLNFLDGIMPVDGAQGTNQNTHQTGSSERLNANENTNEISCTTPVRRRSSADEEKTLNELSLRNFQIDNATTPQLSPDQTIYLDVKDFSDSDNDDQSDVGWTYYNKVMNHVNNMLQDSQMPSSAGALHRQALGRCARLHVDRTDVSVITSKRVTFDQNPVQIEPPQPFSKPLPSSDASLQMKKLAVKYLNENNAADVMERPLDRKSPEIPLDMSLATRKYMEQHNLIQGEAKSPVQLMPTKFLDITALKQQPKLL